MAEVNLNNYKKIDFFDLPEVDNVKDLSGVGLDVAVIVTLAYEITNEKSDLYFKSRHKIVNRAKELDAELIKKQFSPINRTDTSQFFIFSSNGKFADTILFAKTNIVEL
ncbi:hypothetical protein ABIB40_000010 [Pedobacter sp. UYP30]|uniref:hypothetical protein n=1 Tax=Pedobacter sp. UYP30 TaxID=1756400 RepID=UPI0033986283